MGPKDSRDTSETNRKNQPTGSSKGKATVSRTMSTESFPDLTPEAVDQGITALREISRILHLAQAYHDKIDIFKDIHGLHIDQQERNEELESMVDELTFRKNREMKRLQDDNEAYRVNADQLEREREELKQEQATIKDKRLAMQSEMERRKEKGISEAKQDFTEKFKARSKQIKEDYEKQIKALEKDRDKWKDAVRDLEAKNVTAQSDFKQREDSFELEKRSFQSHIVRLETDLRHINAASIVSPQTSEFYIEGFHQLRERIRDVAVKDFRFLPENTELLDSDEVRAQLFSASTIFKFHPLLSESAISTFLRGYAIQDFLSRKTISIIRQKYFVAPIAAVDHKSGTHSLDSILDTISNVPAENSSQDLAWRLMTVDKLDHLNSRSPSAAATVATEPDRDAIIREILGQLHHFQDPSNQQLDVNLLEIANITVRLWSALRKDSCQIYFDYNPSTDDWQEWEFVDRMVSSSSAKVSTSNKEIPVAHLPSKPFVLFPRITGSFDSHTSTPHIIHAGLALSHDSPAFREGLAEIEHIDSATRDLTRKIRRGSSAQSSPDVSKYQGIWTTMPNRTSKAG